MASGGDVVVSTSNVPRTGDLLLSKVDSVQAPSHAVDIDDRILLADVARVGGYDVPAVRSSNAEVGNHVCVLCCHLMRLERCAF